MRLTDVLELAAREGVRRHVQKRAGIVVPLTVGAMLPGIAHKAMERAHSTERKIDEATNQPFKTAALPLQLSLPMAQIGQKLGPMFGAAGNAAKGMGGALAGGAKGSLGAIGGAAGGGVAQGISGGIGESIKRMMLGRDFGEKKDPFHMGASSAIGAFGKEMGTTGANLLRDMANKAVEAVGHAGDQSARDAIIGDLKRTDPVLSAADDATLMEAYHTMSRFAPVLSTDKNAVRSFLRQAVMSGSGPDFMSIKLVADAEHAVAGDKHANLDLHALLAAAAKPALAGAAVGGISGAIADKDDRSGGALRGALSGGALGGLGGALHGHMTSAPKDQGPLQPSGNYKGLMAGGVPYDALQEVHPTGARNFEEHLRDMASSRMVPTGVAPTAHALNTYDLEDLGLSADASARDRNSAVFGA